MSERMASLSVRKAAFPWPVAFVSHGSVIRHEFWGFTRNHALGRAAWWALRHAKPMERNGIYFPQVVGTRRDLGLPEIDIPEENQ